MGYKNDVLSRFFLPAPQGWKDGVRICKQDSRHAGERWQKIVAQINKHHKARMNKQKGQYNIA